MGAACCKGPLGFSPHTFISKNQPRENKSMKNCCFKIFPNETVNERLFCSDLPKSWHQVISAENCLNPVTSQINSALWSHHIALVFSLSLQCEKMRCCKTHEGRRGDEDIEKQGGLLWLQNQLCVCVFISWVIPEKMSLLVFKCINNRYIYSVVSFFCIMGHI